MVPVREAIESGAWLHCSSDDDEVQFRIRVLSFKKFTISQVDDPHKIEHIDPGAVWWLMELEVTNLCKTPLFPWTIKRALVLMDKDGFQFYVNEDFHLHWNSEFGLMSGLRRFRGADRDYLGPKTKAVGAIAFQLPDDDDAEYSLAMKNGTVREA